MHKEADLSVDTCVTIRGTCPAEYAICGQLVEFHFGGQRDGFYFAFDATALRKLAILSSEAVAQLDASSTGTCAGAVSAGELVGTERRST